MDNIVLQTEQQAEQLLFKMKEWRAVQGTITKGDVYRIIGALYFCDPYEYPDSDERLYRLDKAKIIPNEKGWMIKLI